MIPGISSVQQDPVRPSPRPCPLRGEGARRKRKSGGANHHRLRLQLHTKLFAHTEHHLLR